MRCFERLVMTHVHRTGPQKMLWTLPSTGPFHIWRTRVMLFIDYSSTYSKVIPDNLRKSTQAVEHHLQLDPELSDRKAAACQNCESVNVGAPRGSVLIWCCIFSLLTTVLPPRTTPVSSIFWWYHHNWTNHWRKWVPGMVPGQQSFLKYQKD